MCSFCPFLTTQSRSASSSIVLPSLYSLDVALIRLLKSIVSVSPTSAINITSGSVQTAQNSFAVHLGSGNKIHACLHSLGEESHMTADLAL